MPGALDQNDRLPERSATIATPEAEKPSFFEGIASAFRVTRADTTGYVEGAQLEAYAPVIEQLRELGYPVQSFVNTGTGTVSPSAVLKAVDVERINGYFADVPATVEEFEKQWRANERLALERDTRRMENAGTAARLVGGIAGAMTDPVNYYTMGVGGLGRTLVTRLATEALAGIAIETALIPVAQGNRAELGRKPMTKDEALTNIAFAGAGAAVLRGAGEGVAHHWDAIKAAPKAGQEKAWGVILDGTPGLREKVGSGIDWDALDPHLPDIAEGLAGGRDNLPLEQVAAVDELRSAGQFARANPYVDDTAGRMAHAEGVALAMKRILDDAPRARTQPMAIVPQPDLRSGTAIGSRVVAGDAFEIVKRRIGVVESGGSDTAKNPRSSATGRYQFIGSTWLKLYRNRYGRNGLSDAQVLAKRSDGRLQDVLMDDLMQINADALEAAGIPVDAGNLYLAHFAGSGGARALHRASPKASARSVLGDAVVNANPFLDRMNAGDVIAWAARKMGGGGERALPALRGPDDGAAEVSVDSGPSLGDQFEKLRQQRVAGAEEIAIATPPARNLADDPVQVDEIAADIPAIRPELQPDGTMAEAVRDVLPPLRQLARASDRNLGTDIAGLAEELRAPEGAVREALDMLVRDGVLDRRRAVAQDPDPDGLLGAVRARLDDAIAAAGDDAVEAARLTGIARRIDTIAEADGPRDGAAELHPTVATWRKAAIDPDGIAEAPRLSESEADMAIALGRRIAAAEGRATVRRADVAEGADFVVRNRETSPTGRGGDEARADAVGVEADRGPLDAERYAEFDDPAGRAAQGQLDSMAHDVRALAGDGDAQLNFRFDPEGETQSLADLVAEIEADEAEIKAIMECAV